VRDWTLAAYERLCSAVLDAGYRVQTIEGYIEAPAARAVVLRHDVDRVPANARAMAELEHALGVASTYYFRTVPGAYDRAAVAAVAALGHEVGYHYEVVSKANGDPERAAELFRAELADLRAMAPVRTASAHGSPLSRWSNHDLWRHCRPADFDLLGEAYLDIDYATLAYYTDTGRAWDAGAANLRDRVEEGTARFPRVHGTAELTALVAGGTLARLCIQTHPERWNARLPGLVRSVLWDGAANAAKVALRGVRAATG